MERPFRFIREDFFLGGTFRNLDDLNAQLRHWLDTVANPRVHATTKSVVNEAFAEEKPALKALSVTPYRTVLPSLCARQHRRRDAAHAGRPAVARAYWHRPGVHRRRSRHDQRRIAAVEKAGLAYILCVRERDR